MDKSVTRKVSDLFVNVFDREPDEKELSFLENIEALISEIYLLGLREGAEASAYLKGIANSRKEGDLNG